jgi:hypothetical protein
MLQEQDYIKLKRLTRLLAGQRFLPGIPWEDVLHNVCVDILENNIPSYLWHKVVNRHINRYGKAECRARSRHIDYDTVCEVIHSAS